MTGHPAELRIELWATPADLVGLRESLAGWVASTTLSQDRQEDIVLAAYEALANSAEHAYPGGDGGPVELVARCEHGGVTVVVADRGTWKTPDADPGFRGRGRLLMRRLSDRMHTERGRRGTTVTITWLLAP
ncbi:MAG: ATP-binding protein [Pseudonocardiaceae bacterium]|nr:MAG: ATP-binding protein [Pseudonocardiaceae bacterium]